jgi:hypothetical protein
MLSALLLLSVAAPQTQSLELYRGAPTPAGQRYWAVEETTLDSTRADINQGGFPILNGGQGKTILVQFKDLDRTLGPNKKITKAELVLTLTVGERIALSQVGKVLAPWTMGPNRTIAAATRRTDGPEQAARWSATWRNRRAGQDAIAWQQAGATGPGDVQSIQGATASRPQPDQVVIGGLEQAVQEQYERWYDNHGFALRFEAPVEFLSSLASEGRPILRLEFEEVEPATGSDLSVITIARTPEYDRFDNRDAYTFREQNGHSAGVMDRVPNAAAQKWPMEREELTYTARIKNVGDSPSQGFSIQWYVREQPGAIQVVPRPLQPGEETTVTTTLPYRSIHTDHRVQPIALKVVPSGPDAVAANNFLKIQQSALNLGIYVEQGFYDEMSRRQNLIGSRSFEDWIQAQFRVWNDVYFHHSRFSFAPEGVLERVRVQRITVVPNGTLKGDNWIPDGSPTLAYDGEWGFPWGTTDEEQARAQSRVGALAQRVDPGLIRSLSTQIGLIPLDVMNVAASTPDALRDVLLRQQGQVVPRGFVDRFPGVMGGGDTRYDGAVLGTLQYPYEPRMDPIADAVRMEATDLYAMTDVAGLNSNLGRRRGYTGEYLYDLPGSVMIEVQDFAGRRVPNAELAFFQMSNGKIEDREPVFTLSTGPAGTSALPLRDPEVGASSFTTYTNHTLRPNPFGRLDPRGGNGVFLIRCEARGQVEWGFLKAWQLVDLFHRGQSGLALYSMRFNIPSEPVDTATNMALGRAVADSAESMPAALAALVDGEVNGEVELPGQAGAWVEIDLGRDRPMGELRLATRSPEFWQRFEIRTYQTGQRPEEARLWTQETDWAWTIANRRDVMANGSYAVAYRAPAQRVRFIRLINRADGSPAKLADVQVFPLRILP